jgi:repressor LexA
MDDNISIKAKDALRHIRNSIMHQGKVPTVRELMNLMAYKSPRSAMLLLEELEEKGFLERKKEGGYRLLKDLEENSMARTVKVPLVGTVACGVPMLAEENIEAWIPVSVSLARPGGKYFLLRAQGDSMNEAGVEDGDLILVKQQQVADNGQKIVALVDDEATVKEFQRKGEVVALIPRSSNKKHKPVILDRNFQIQGIVITTIPNIEI